MAIPRRPPLTSLRDVKGRRGADATGRPENRQALRGSGFGLAAGSRLGIMREMLSLRTDRCVRVGAGLGLLLLLAAQEKACPWLVTAPVKPERGTGAAPAPPGNEPKPHKRAKKSLPHLLPDTPTLRRSAATSQITLRQTAGARDGVVSCGQRDPLSAGGNSATLAGGDPYGWQLLLGAMRPAGWVLPPARDFRPMDAAVRTCIRPTGPPA